MSLKIAKNLSLPEEAVTQTFAILAKRGVGKTYTASVMAEEMLKARLQTVIIDPIGVWWGLRSAADGKSAGLEIVIAGGDHADVPIQPSNGEIVADLVVNEKLSVVIDLSLFRKGEQTRFMTDFAETLYHRNRSALHLIIDEADAFAPQRAMKGQERMLGAVEDIVRRGRARGIGVTLITQRPAVLHKDVLTQVEVLIPMRLIAPQDRNAIDAWIQVHGEPGQREKLMNSLPSLPIGTAWFWSPGWLDIFKRVEVRKRETLDSSSTPKVGQKIKTANMAKVNLDELRKQLGETIAAAEANNPSALKRKILELERELQQKPEAKPVIQKIEVPVIPDPVQTCIKMVLNDFQTLGEHIAMLQKYVAENTKMPLRITPKPEASKDQAIFVDENKIQVPKKSGLAPFDVNKYDTGRKNKAFTVPTTQDEAPKITGGAKRMLEVLASRFPMTFTRAQLATLSKMSPRSGTFGTYMSLLKSNGLINQDGNTISLTDEGMDYISDGPLPAPQTTDEVIDMWRNNLTGGARRMFDVLVNYYPSTLSREELGREAEISPTSGTFGTYLSMLAGNGLIQRDNQRIRASENLFVGAK